MLAPFRRQPNHWSGQFSFTSHMEPLTADQPKDQANDDRDKEHRGDRNENLRVLSDNADVAGERVIVNTCG